MALPSTEHIQKIVADSFCNTQQRHFLFRNLQVSKILSPTSIELRTLMITKGSLNYIRELQKIPVLKQTCLWYLPSNLKAI